MVCSLMTVPWLLMLPLRCSQPRCGIAADVLVQRLGASQLEARKAEAKLLTAMADDLTVEGASVERELGLFKVKGQGDKRVEALRIGDIFRANVVDSTLESFVFELVGTPAKLDAFADLMRPLGLVDLARTGVAALSRGA